MKETQIKKRFLAHTMNVDSDFESIKLNDEFHLLEEKSTITTNTKCPEWKSDKKSKKITFKNRVLNNDEFENFQSGNFEYTKRNFCVLSNRELNELSQNTYYDFFTENRTIEYHGRGESSEILSKFALDEYNINNIVIIDFDNHFVSHLDGTPVPIGLRADYISHGRISNANYNLNKLVEILSKRDDIVFIVEKGYRASEKVKDISNYKTRDIISDIPYYNAESNRNKTVVFEWHPSKKDITTVYNNLNERNPKFKTSDQLWRSIFETDILGLRSGGAALCEEYHKDIEDDRCDNFTL